MTPAQAWPQAWGALKGKLELQLPPTALGSLNAAFGGTDGLTTLPAFFGAHAAALIGPDAAENVLNLINVLNSVWRSYAAVIELNQVYIRHFPSHAHRIQGAASTVVIPKALNPATAPAASPPDATAIPAFWSVKWATLCSYLCSDLALEPDAVRSVCIAFNIGEGAEDLSKALDLLGKRGYFSTLRLISTLNFLQRALSRHQHKNAVMDLNSAIKSFFSLHFDMALYAAEQPFTSLPPPLTTDPPLADLPQVALVLTLDAFYLDPPEESRQLRLNLLLPGANCADSAYHCVRQDLPHPRSSGITRLLAPIQQTPQASLSSLLHHLRPAVVVFCGTFPDPSCEGNLFVATGTDSQAAQLSLSTKVRTLNKQVCSDEVITTMKNKHPNLFNEYYELLCRELASRGEQSEADLLAFARKHSKESARDLVSALTARADVERGSGDKLKLTTAKAEALEKGALLPRRNSAIPSVFILDDPQSRMTSSTPQDRDLADFVKLMLRHNKSLAELKLPPSTYVAARFAACDARFRLFGGEFTAKWALEFVRNYASAPPHQLPRY